MKAFFEPQYVVIFYCSVLTFSHNYYDFGGFGCHALSTPSPYGGTTRNVATQILQGAGPTTVSNLNRYNIPTERIWEEWTANVVLKANEIEPKLRLGCKSDSELYVDTVQVQFPRTGGGGLGIQLSELAGGREDGLGITVVTGLVEGSSAASKATVMGDVINDEKENTVQSTDDSDSDDGLAIMAGDTISSVSVLRRKKKSGAAALEEKVERFTVSTECLGYDATVDAIVNEIPPFDDKYNDTFQLTLKRIRRKPKVTVKLVYPPSQNEEDAVIELFAGENLRQGMLIRGVKLNDPLAKRFDTKNGGNCGAGGLCRTCSVSIVRGGELLNPQRQAEKIMLADNPRWRLGCKAIVGYGMKEGEIVVKVNPNQWDE